MNDRHPPCILHLGLAKTGTTSLQARFFPALPGIAFSRREAGGTGAILQRVRYASADAAALAGGEDAYLDKLRAKFSALTLAQAKNPVLNSPALISPVLISDERILGPHPDGIAVLARRIKHVCARAKVVLVLRDPMDMLRSIYRQDIDNSVSRMAAGHVYPSDVVPFESYILTALGQGHGGSLGYIHYDDMVAALERNFGADHCLFLDYAQFCRSPGRFLQSLAAFMGVKSTLPADIHRENVSAVKLPNIMAMAASAGFSARQLQDLERNYKDQSISAALNDRLAAYISTHSMGALRRFGPPAWERDAIRRSG